MTCKERKIQIIKELLDKKEISFEQALILLDFDINSEPVKLTPVPLGVGSISTYTSNSTCIGNCDNCTCKK